MAGRLCCYLRVQNTMSAAACMLEVRHRRYVKKISAVYRAKIYLPAYVEAFCGDEKIYLCKGDERRSAAVCDVVGVLVSWYGTLSGVEYHAVCVVMRGMHHCERVSLKANRARLLQYGIGAQYRVVKYARK